MSVWGTFAFSWTAVIEAALAGALGLAFWRLLEKMSHLLPMRPTFRRGLRRAFPAAEAVFWFLFACGALRWVFSNSWPFTLGFALLLAVTVLGAFWYGLRDYIAGTVLKMEDACKPGEYLRTGRTEGRILRIGRLGMHLAGEQGETVRVPYSLLTGSVFAWSDPDGTRRLSFRVSVPKSRGVGDDARDALLLGLLSSPWVPAGASPRIDLSGANDEVYVFQVTLEGADERRLPDIERHVRDGLKST